MGYPPSPLMALTILALTARPMIGQEGGSTGLAEQMRRYARARQYHDQWTVLALAPTSVRMVYDSLSRATAAFQRLAPHSSLSDTSAPFRQFVATQFGEHDSFLVERYAVGLRLIAAADTVSAYAWIAEHTFLPPAHIEVDSSRFEPGLLEPGRAVYYLQEVWTREGAPWPVWRLRYAVEWRRRDSRWELHSIR